MHIIYSQLKKIPICKFLNFSNEETLRYDFNNDEYERISLSVYECLYSYGHSYNWNNGDGTTSSIIFTLEKE